MYSEDDSSEPLLPTYIFQEPEGYFQPEKPATFAEHTLLSGQVLRLRLVGFNPLWVQSHPLNYVPRQSQPS